jgi:hypothetical protein
LRFGSGTIEKSEASGEADAGSGLDGTLGGAAGTAGTGGFGKPTGGNNGDEPSGFNVDAGRDAPGTDKGFKPIELGA